MDNLASDDVVGPEEGTKPRRIIMNLTQFEQFLLSGSSGAASDEEESAGQDNDDLSSIWLFWKINGKSAQFDRLIFVQFSKYRFADLWAIMNPRGDKPKICS